MEEERAVGEATDENFILFVVVAAEQAYRRVGLESVSDSVSK